MTKIYVQPSVMPAATPTELLAQARHGFDEATDHPATCLAALRAAAAVIADRVEPNRKYGQRMTSSWLLLAQVEPQLHEWAGFFAANKQLTTVTAEQYRTETGRFIAVVEGLLTPAVVPAGTARDGGAVSDDTCCERPDSIRHCHGEDHGYCCPGGAYVPQPDGTAVYRSDLTTAEVVALAQKVRHGGAYYNEHEELHALVAIVQEQATLLDRLREDDALSAAIHGQRDKEIRLLREQRDQVLALADECAEASEGNCPWSHKVRAVYGAEPAMSRTEIHDLRGQVQTLRGICRDLQRMPGYDPAEVYVTVQTIREILGDNESETTP